MDKDLTSTIIMSTVFYEKEKEIKKEKLIRVSVCRYIYVCPS